MGRLPMLTSYASRFTSSILHPLTPLCFIRGKCNQVLDTTPARVLLLHGSSPVHCARHTSTCMSTRLKMSDTRPTYTRLLSSLWQPEQARVPQQSTRPPTACMPLLQHSVSRRYISLGTTPNARSATSAPPLSQTKFACVVTPPIYPNQITP